MQKRTDENKSVELLILLGALLGYGKSNDMSKTKRNS